MTTADQGPNTLDVPEPGDADPRRRHWAWAYVQEGRVELLDGLAALVAEWRDVPLRHELELGTFATDVARRVDALLGEYACRVWYALLELRDDTPTWRTPTLERELSPAAHPRVVAAHEAARAAAAAGPTAAWDGGVPEVRERLAVIEQGLRALVLGRPIPDLLIATLESLGGTPPPAVTEGPARTVDAAPSPGMGGLRLVP